MLFIQVMNVSIHFQRLRLQKPSLEVTVIRSVTNYEENI